MLKNRKITLDDYKDKPKKTLLPAKERNSIFRELKKTMRSLFDENASIQEIRIYGSASKKRFGEYKMPYKGRQKSDIDTIILIKGLKSNLVKLKKGIRIMDNGYGLDKKGNWLNAKGHPFFIELATKKEFYDNIDKPYPKGYGYAKEGLILFSR